MSAAFDRAFALIVGHEGGYVNDPRDPGGETKFGISKRAFPRLDIAGLTLAQAKAIYLASYWGPARCEGLPWPVAVNLFDGAVNSGVRQSVRWMQEAAGVKDDGAVGPVTLRAWGAADPAALAARYNGLRLLFMATRRTWPTFSKGWAKRIAGNLIATIPL